MAFLGGVKSGEAVCLGDETLWTGGSGRTGIWPISLSADGSSIAYRFSQGSSVRLVHDGRESPPFLRLGNLVLNRDGRVIAFRATRMDGAEVIRIGDREEGPYDFATDPVITPDGATVAYGFKRGSQWHLRAGDKESPLSAKPESLFISADGKSVGWIELVPQPEGSSKMRVMAPDSIGAAYSLVGRPVFSPTEPLIAYGAEDDDRKYVVIGTRKTGTFDRVSDPVFSPDGRKVGYGARIGPELWWRVLDVASHR